MQPAKKIVGQKLKPAIGRDFVLRGKLFVTLMNVRNMFKDVQIISMTGVVPLIINTVILEARS